MESAYSHKCDGLFQNSNYTGDGEGLHDKKKLIKLKTKIHCM